MDLNERVTRVWHGLFESVERNDAAGVRSALDEMHALNSEIRAENERLKGQHGRVPVRELDPNSFTRGPPGLSKTPLDVAIEREKPEIAELLRQRGVTRTLVQHRTTLAPPQHLKPPVQSIKLTPGSILKARPHVK